MKHQLIAIALALLFAPLTPQNTRAQTGVWEIPCVTSGVCLVIGSYILGGITYYTLQNRRTGRTWDIDGRNLQNHRQPIVQPGPRPNMRISNPDEPYHGQIIDYVWGDSEWQARQRCEQIAQQSGLRYVKVRQTSQRGKKWECHVDNL